MCDDKNTLTNIKSVLEQELDAGKDVTRSDSNNNTLGRKYDQDKIRYDLLPYDVIEQLAIVLTFGAKKYEPDNWQKVPNFTNRYFASLMRHLVAWRNGESNDTESGLPHLSHALACLTFLVWEHNKSK